MNYQNKKNIQKTKSHLSDNSIYNNERKKKINN